MPKAKSTQLQEQCSLPADDNVTLSVSITKEQYSQLLHTISVLGYTGVDEWLKDAVENSI